MVQKYTAHRGFGDDVLYKFTCYITWHYVICDNFLLKVMALAVQKRN